MNIQDAFRQELRQLICQKLDQINHYISGVNSPFGTVQIMEVQNALFEIRDILGEKEEWADGVVSGTGKTKKRGTV